MSMKNIKKYNLFLESEEKLWAGVQHEYDIYDWFEDLKRYQWKAVEKQRVNESSVKFWCNHFIGDGWYEKILSHADKIINSLKKVDTDYINDRMYDIYDEFAPDKQKWTMCSVLYGDVERYNNTNRTKFNGLLSVPKPNEKGENLRIAIHIMKDIIQPTLSIGGFRNNVDLRNGQDERCVTDKKYQCQNFNIMNYKISSDKGTYDSPSITPSYIKQKQKYDINLYLDMYQPGIVINIGGYSNYDGTGKFRLKDLEDKLDDTLPSILHDLDYKEVIFDHSRYTRQFSDSESFTEYTLKILLKI